MREQCTTSDYRRIGRWEHEHVVEALEARLEREPERMRIRAIDGGTPVRHVEMLDGLYALSDERVVWREYGDES